MIRMITYFFCNKQRNIVNYNIPKYFSRCYHWKLIKGIPDEWIKKMWYLHTMEFYSAMKKNEILSFAGKWMELENIILSEVSQAMKTKNSMFSFICRL
jgi:hypothetical protein